MSDLVLNNLTKRFGELIAVDAVDLRVGSGEFVVVVGPSGCGKTTTLRLIAGLEQPSEGHIYLDGRPIDRLPPKDRDIAMVFQDPALYPHLDVCGNLAFGLRMRSISRTEIEQRVAEISRLLGIAPLLGRRPSELSGGQQQRVALGRALVRRPALFLLDEPFSNLDAPLRDGMRRELALLQRELATTTVHVTHDQEEALQLGRRIVVLNKGRIQQIGSPQEIYDQPANRFVAGFVGSPPMNFFEARLIDRDGRRRLDAVDFQIEDQNDSTSAGVLDGLINATIGIRPEHLTIGRPPSGLSGPSWRAEIILIQTLGAATRLELRSASHQFTACVTSGGVHSRGDMVDVWADSRHCHLFNAQTGRRLTV